MRSLHSDPELAELQKRVLHHASAFGRQIPEIRFFILDRLEFASLLEKDVYPTSPINIWEGKRMVHKKHAIETGLESALYYEVVQTGDPSYAYLNDSNNAVSQASVMAHVVGHCEFSERNVLGDSNPDRTEFVMYLVKKVDRARRQMGEQAYLEYWNAAESATVLIAPNSQYDLERSTETESMFRGKTSPSDEMDRPDAPAPLVPVFDTMTTLLRGTAGSTSFEGELRKRRRDETMSRRGYILKSPCQDVLDFLRHHAPTSQAEHAILDYKYVTKAPQDFVARTQIMNDGWAMYWEKKIMHALFEERAVKGIIDYARVFSSVCSPRPYFQRNPYHLGYNLWCHIEQLYRDGKVSLEYREEIDRDKKNRWREDSSVEPIEALGHLVDTVTDYEFLRRFLTPQLVHELHLNRVDRRTAERLGIKDSDIVEQDKRYVWLNPEPIKDEMLGFYTHFYRPRLYVIDSDYQDGCLLLYHRDDGRSLRKDWIRPTLRNLNMIWKAPVALLTKDQLFAVMGNQYKSEEVKPVPFEQIVERMQKGGATFPRELSPGMDARLQMKEGAVDLRSFLGGSKPRSLRFSEFVDAFVEDPLGCLRTSSTLISEAIQHFGFEIVVRSGEPAVSYNVFKDPFSAGTNAVFGQEYCVKQIVDVIESVGKESSPQRGIVLVGPPASGKTNIVDLLSLALEEYSKHKEVKLFGFYFRFENNGRVVEFRPRFRHNPILLFPTSSQFEGRTTHPRQEFFEYINEKRPPGRRVVFPTFYQNATIDKRSLDIIEKVMHNPRNAGKTLFDILEEYVRVEEIDFSNAQAKGVANIDDMNQLQVDVRPVSLGDDHRAVVNEHLPGAHLYQYEGAMVAANRGLLHIHDAFGGEDDGGPSEQAYKPLLMLLGSGKASIEATQTPIDTTVIATTNLEEMIRLEHQLTSSKLLDRIEEIPVNYLLDAYSEMDILRRDMSNIRQKYDVDPNLLRIATYFSVLTRLLPPMKVPPLASWSDAKKSLYYGVTPEQKLFIYTAQPADPVATILKLPQWHPFRSELIRLGVDIRHLDRHENLIARQLGRTTLEQSGMFTIEQLKLIDDDFMRALWIEHYPYEGKNGISVRQLQNLMRDTIANSNGFRVHVGTFFSRLKKTLAEGPALHRWLGMDDKYRKDRKPCSKRAIGEMELGDGEGDYGDFAGLVKVTKAIYNDMIRREITIATVNRDPNEIGGDLRKYIQHVLLKSARENRAFAHIMIKRFTYFDPATGQKVDEADTKYMASIERILSPGILPEVYRREMAERFLDMSDSGELTIEEGKSVVSSRNDNFLNCFGQEYQKLLSHRRTIGDINPEKVRDALFQRRIEPEKYDSYDEKVRQHAEDILQNLKRRFGYSQESALDTVLFALRKRIIDFDEIIS